MSAYSSKLQDPRWQKKRLAVMERDSWTCQECGSTEKTLNVHHVVYRKIDPWDYPDYLYQTLCVDCHKERQELTDKIVDALRIAIKSIPTKRLIKSSEVLCDAAMIEMEVPNA